MNKQHIHFYISWQKQDSRDNWLVGIVFNTIVNQRLKGIYCLDSNGTIGSLNYCWFHTLKGEHTWKWVCFEHKHIIQLLLQ